MAGRGIGWILSGVGVFGASGRYGAPRTVGKLLSVLSLILMPLLAHGEEPVKIVALGDSLVQGYGLPQQDGFVPQLEAWLRVNGAPEAELINAGVSGDTSAGGLARLDWTFAGGGDALIVVLGGNDLLRGIAPAVTRENLDILIGKARSQGLPVLLSGMAAPGNYGPQYKAEFDAIYPDLAAKHDALLDPQFLAGVIENRHLWQPDGLHPNAAGVNVIVNRLGPMVLRLIAEAESK